MAATKKRSLTIAGHATSISLEPEFWDELKRVADLQGRSIAELVATVDAARGGNLSSAVRVYLLRRLQAAAPEA